MVLRTPPCIWCFWTPYWKTFKLWCAGGQEAAKQHRIVKSLADTGFKGVIIIRQSWALLVVHIDAGINVLSVHFFRSRAFYQRARWATELDYERTVYDCRQPE